MKLKRAWYNLLDSLQSWWNRKGPQVSLAYDSAGKLVGMRRTWLHWGRTYGGYVRTGRRYTRYAEVLDRQNRIVCMGKRGWIWFCQNCHEFSITPRAIDGCTNCCFQPGAPE